MKRLLAAIAICATTATAQDGAVEIRATPDGAQAAVDLAALAGSEAVQAAPWYRKPDVAAWEGIKATASGIAAHPFATLAGVVTGWAGYRASEGKLDNDFRKLARYVKTGSGGHTPHVAPPEPIPQDPGWSAVVEGNEGDTELYFHGSAPDNTAAVVRGNAGDTRIVFGDAPESEGL